MESTGMLDRFFLWLAGAGSEGMDKCPEWERRRYMALGATVLVPFLFALMAAAYAISTVTNNLMVIAGVSICWASIILTIDRALLTSYRPFQGVSRTIAQFVLRFFVAGLIGLTIAHPMTLLLFKDTIRTVIEENRSADMEKVRANGDRIKAGIEKKISTLDGQVLELREKIKDTYAADFISAAAEGKPALASISDQLSPEEKKEMEKRLAEARGPLEARRQMITSEMNSLQPKYDKLAGELDFWQKEFEREINGQRSGIVGKGPRAKSIEADQILWRRKEADRLSRSLDVLTTERNQVTAQIEATERSVLEAIENERRIAVDQRRAEQEELEALHQQVLQDQAGLFAEQQTTVRESYQFQIDGLLEEIGRLRGELAAVESQQLEELKKVREDSRWDILTQTLALHTVFEFKDGRGQFALTAYIILTVLFVVVDTIPLVVKFFSKPGPYDSLVNRDEIQFDQERLAFSQVAVDYFRDENRAQMASIARDLNLDPAMMDQFKRNHASKDYLQVMLNLERAFQDTLQRERQAIGEANPDEAARRLAVLDEMAERFYSAMRDGIQGYFRPEGSA
jgi:hypothetical protein